MAVRLWQLSKAVGLAALVALFVAPAGQVQAVIVWQTEVVDTAGDVGRYTSLELDADGRPHISYYDDDQGDLKYAHHDSAGWQIETVDSDGDVGKHTSLALDSAGRPHISYYDESNLDLKYARHDGAGWQIETVDGADNVGVWPSLALDGDNQPHITYYDQTNGDLKYATFIGGAWQFEVIANTRFQGMDSSIAFDAQGRLHLAYRVEVSSSDPVGLTYAYRDGDAWQRSVVDHLSQINSDIVLRIDSQGHANILYYSSAYYGGLKYARQTSTGWEIETIDQTAPLARGTSLALDSQDRAHISFWKDDERNLLYLHETGAGWEIETIDSNSGMVGAYNSIEVDVDDMPHISYYNGSKTELKYARLMDNLPPTVEAGGPYSGAEGSLIILDGTVSDPESAGLTTAWTYTITSADPGTTCAFGNASQVDTSFTCTDDGSFTLTLTANDGLNPPVTDTATVTIANVAPAISDLTATRNGAQVTLTVTASDPGANDVLSYAFDCNNDGVYEVDAGATPSTTCPLNPQQEGAFTFGAQVSDDDGGITTDAVTVTIASELCANDYTGVLRYTSTCQGHETTITIPDPNGPVTVCASRHNGLLRWSETGACAGHEISYELPEDGPLNVCINNHTRMMRAVGDITKCSSHEFRRVIAATDVGEIPTPRSR